ncbi:MAG TPA: hypothetical protein VFN68_01640 [Acidimicrobiales bacterium]|nr:hypothetical protein [Acidimicrobiales bacterium]
MAGSGDSTATTALTAGAGGTSAPALRADVDGTSVSPCPARTSISPCPARGAGDAPPAPGRAETAIRKVLRVPVGPPKASDDAANRLFSASIALSALRCLFTYIVVPVLVPLVGPAVGDSPAIGIPLSLLALVFDVRAVRRFWLANHPWRWRMTAVYAVLMVMVGALLVIDIVHAVS